jgi:hypothetical protein
MVGGWSLAPDERPIDLSELRRGLDREMLLQALEPRRCCDARIADWLERLYHQHGGLKDSGALAASNAHWACWMVLHFRRSVLSRRT